MLACNTTADKDGDQSGSSVSSMFQEDQENSVWDPSWVPSLCHNQLFKMHTYWFFCHNILIVCSNHIDETSIEDLCYFQWLWEDERNYSVLLFLNFLKKFEKMLSNMSCSKWFLGLLCSWFLSSFPFLSSPSKAYVSVLLCSTSLLTIFYE